MEVKLIDQPPRARNRTEKILCGKGLVVDVNTPREDTRACRKQALWNINGVPMCSHHGGLEALKFLAKETKEGWKK